MVKLSINIVELEEIKYFLPPFPKTHYKLGLVASLT